ncbi:hypothetical protein M7I_8055 [Glarea lozoyensis 74030]|uniref:Uncharacterized protein n=1 Tax=Glarea lozoyensis (strain ATCC 74030 / MF5533) TaxID=1104152 RepID=H0EYZ3_GLAL7|nr:hypothetical protein M7I_8055 [Glarea lozoyensis 74030]
MDEGCQTVEVAMDDAAEALASFSRQAVNVGSIPYPGLPLVSPLISRGLDFSANHPILSSESAEGDGTQSQHTSLEDRQEDIYGASPQGLRHGAFTTAPSMFERSASQSANEVPSNNVTEDHFMAPELYEQIHEVTSALPSDDKDLSDHERFYVEEETDGNVQNRSRSPSSSPLVPAQMKYPDLDDYSQQPPIPLWANEPPAVTYPEFGISETEQYEHRSSSRAPVSAPMSRSQSGQSQAQAVDLTESSDEEGQSQQDDDADGEAEEISYPDELRKERSLDQRHTATRKERMDCEDLDEETYENDEQYMSDEPQEDSEDEVHYKYDVDGDGNYIDSAGNVIPGPGVPYTEGSEENYGSDEGSYDDEEEVSGQEDYSETSARAPAAPVFIDLLSSDDEEDTAQPGTAESLGTEPQTASRQDSSSEEEGEEDDEDDEENDEEQDDEQEQEEGEEEEEREKMNFESIRTKTLLEDAEDSVNEQDPENIDASNEGDQQLSEDEMEVDEIVPSNANLESSPHSEIHDEETEVLVEDTQVVVEIKTTVVELQQLEDSRIFRQDSVPLALEPSIAEDSKHDAEEEEPETEKLEHDSPRNVDVDDSENPTIVDEQEDVNSPLKKPIVEVVVTDAMDIDRNDSEDHEKDHSVADEQSSERAVPASNDSVVRTVEQPADDTVEEESGAIIAQVDDEASDEEAEEAVETLEEEFAEIVSEAVDEAVVEVMAAHDHDASASNGNDADQQESLPLKHLGDDNKRPDALELPEDVKQLLKRAEEVKHLLTPEHTQGSRATPAIETSFNNSNDSQVSTILSPKEPSHTVSNTQPDGLSNTEATEKAPSLRVTRARGKVATTEALSDNPTEDLVQGTATAERAETPKQIASPRNSQTTKGEPTLSPEISDATHVSSVSRGFALRSDQTGASSWAVFKGGDEVQAKGPPVEYGDEEKDHISQLRHWYGTLDSTAMVKINRANSEKGMGSPTGKL